MVVLVLLVVLVLGRVADPRAVLVRPDGHVAWVADGATEPVVDALARWFGPPGPVRGAGDRWHAFRG